MGIRLASLLFAPVVFLSSTPALATLSQHEGVSTFIDRMVSEHAFEREALQSLFDRVELRDDIIRAITRPAEAKPWFDYRPIFVTESRIAEGVAFWREHGEVLAAAERRFGVPAPIIVAILGVETRYGQHRGRYRVMDSLATLAFDYPPRSAFFTKQLEHYLLMAREEGFDPLELTGSYAGAMGQPQFIASSFRAYAVDFDDDGRRDLWDNAADVIGSIANYFAEHRWQRGAPITAPARVQGERHRQLAEKGYKPSVKVADLHRYGVEPTVDFDPQAEAALLALESDASGAREHWVALHNFYVITRYNHSPLYAMAVYQLAEGIRSAHNEAAVARSVD